MKIEIRHWVLRQMRGACGAALLVAVLGVGCGPVSDDNDSEAALEKPYRVVATVGMIADIVREVVGSEGKVRGLIGEGVDPHLYKPTRNR